LTVDDGAGKLIAVHEGVVASAEQSGVADKSLIGPLMVDALGSLARPING